MITEAPAPPAESTAGLALPPIDEAFIKARTERAVAQGLDAASRINPRAKMRMQAVYDALAKTMPTKWLDKANGPPSICVMDDVRSARP